MDSEYRSSFARPSVGGHCRVSTGEALALATARAAKIVVNRILKGGTNLTLAKVDVNVDR